MTVKELIKHLEGYNPDDVIAYDLWSVDDVMGHSNYYEGHNPPPNTEQAEEVIRRMEHHKDASVGLSWDVLDYHLGEVMSDEGQAI